jgi:signal transduction histidine kinase
VRPRRVDKPAAVGALLVRAAAQPQWLAFLESLLLLSIIGWADLITGYQTTLAVFYSLPILLAVCFCDRISPFAISALCCAVWSWADLASGHEYFSAGVHAWEISVRSAFFFAVAMAGVAVKDQQQLAAARVAALEELRRMEHQITKITEYEEQRAGRELHDGLCQYLAALACAMTALKMDIEGRDLPELAVKAKDIESLLATAVSQARDLARNLAPVQKEEAGLAAALQELTAATSRRFGIECSFEGVGENHVQANGHATYLYRIAQEAIDNAVQHGNARAVDVRLSANRDAMSLSVADNGTGFARTEQNLQGPGIDVMRHRVSVLGGELEIESAPGGGTIISCTVPVAELN